MPYIILKCMNNFGGGAPNTLLGTPTMISTPVMRRYIDGPLISILELKQAFCGPMTHSDPKIAPPRDGVPTRRSRGGYRQ